MTNRAIRYTVIMTFVLGAGLLGGTTQADTSSFTYQLSQTAHIPYMPILPLRAGGLAMGDFNGDGQMDAALPGLYIAGIDIISGGSETWISTGAGPAAVAAADMDGDGDIDLAVCERHAGGVAVYINDGLGHFTRSGFYATGAGPVAVAAADIDKDGRLDLVVANRFGETVVILHNTGGGYMSWQTISVPGEPNALAAADLDNDGWLDVAVACASDDTLRILKNTSGVLARGGAVPAGPYPVAVAPADLDGDGKMDLVVADREATQVTVLLQTSGMTFTPADVALGPAGASFDPPTDVQLVDINYDGHPDIRCAGKTLLNDGAGNFSLTESKPWTGAVYARGMLASEPYEFLGMVHQPATGTNIVSVAYNVGGDTNGDGHVDVSDLLTLVYNLGLSAGDPGFDPAADINKDGIVDTVDLLSLVDNFGV
jgi:hypothetical protein